MIRFNVGQAFANCSGVSRRSFLTAGSAGIAGLSLPEILAQETFAGNSFRKEVIDRDSSGRRSTPDGSDRSLNRLLPANCGVHLVRSAPAVAGLQLTELMPQCAKIADKLVFLRSLVGSDGKHHAFQCQSGYGEKALKSLGGRPALGCVVKHLLGKPEDEVPNFIDLMQGRPLVRNSARPGFLGIGCKPFRPDISEYLETRA